MRLTSIFHSLSFSLLTMLMCGPAYAFDSECADQHGDACEEGPLAARGNWNTDTSEHAIIWRVSTSLAGLPQSLDDTLSITAYTDGSTIVSEGQSLPSILPAEFHAVLKQETRTFSISDLAQLPDFSYALWDWASGNETCPIGDDISVERCHQLKAHMGSLNSNHFLPQAFYAYRAYHQLALDQAEQCSQVASSVSASSRESLRESFLLPCEKLALIYESVGQHFLQDAWSMGHMWERWGAPNRDTMSDHFNALAVGSTTGLIHGSRSSLQPALSFLGDFNDALCAPYHQEVQWRVHEEEHSHPAVGDLYIAEILNDEDPLYATQSGEFSEQSRRLFSCSVNGLLEVYRASGQQHGSATPTQDLLPLDPQSEADCFGQRATNEAMFKGAGIDVLWGGFWPYHLEIDSYTATMAVIAASTYYSDNFEDLSWGEYFWKQHQYRRDLARMVSRMELYAKLDPKGVQIASGAIGPLMDILPNGDYHGDDAIGDYTDIAVHPFNSDLNSAATARLFHQANGLAWCVEYSGTQGRLKLARLRYRAQHAETQAGQEAACGICTEVVTRHVRRGENRHSYDTSTEPLCAIAPSLTLIPHRPAMVYQEGSGYESSSELAQQWCGCTD